MTQKAPSCGLHTHRMAQYDEKLKAMAAQLKKGVAPQRETVRSFLLWFGAERRGYRVVREIRAKLRTYGIATTPDFEYAYIDGYIGFRHATGEEGQGPAAGTAATDPTHRIGRLGSANRVPVSVKPDAALQQAVTLMLTHDFSQLPVMTNGRDVKGILSWKTIGSRLALKRTCAFARDCMEPAHIIQIEDSLFSAIATISSHDYVLVQAHDKTICGIITATDLNEQFRKLAEPFLLVGEIENGIRGMLHGKFSAKELE